MPPTLQDRPGTREAHNMRILGHDGLGGKGDCMHVNVARGHAYVGHQGYSDAGTSVVDVSDPEHPRLVTQINRPAGTHTHKVQVVDDILVVNHERNAFDSPAPTSWSAGLAIYDVSTPDRPRQIGFFETPGSGVHRMTYWSAPYAYVSGTAEGFIGRILQIVDLSDPSRPVEVGRWWYPGQHQAGGEPLTWTPGSGRFPPPGTQQKALHHGVPHGDRLYCGWWEAGLIILDISDPTRPALAGHLDFEPESVNTHTALPVPEHQVVVVTDETLTRNVGTQKHVRIVDVSDEARPQVIAKLPVPEGDYHERGIRFGPHNLHEPRPGSLADPDTLYLTYFAGGLRAYDISDPAQPTEIAYLVPELPYRLPGSPSPVADAVQLNDLTVAEDGLIYVTDRHGGGLYVVEHQR